MASEIWLKGRIGETVGEVVPDGDLSEGSADHPSLLDSDLLGRMLSSTLRLSSRHSFSLSSAPGGSKRATTFIGGV